MIHLTKLMLGVNLQNESKHFSTEYLSLNFDYQAISPNGILLKGENR